MGVSQAPTNHMVYPLNKVAVSVMGCMTCLRIGRIRLRWKKEFSSWDYTWQGWCKWRAVMSISYNLKKKVRTKEHRAQRWRKWIMMILPDFFGSALLSHVCKPVKSLSYSSNFHWVFTTWPEDPWFRHRLSTSCLAFAYWKILIGSLTDLIISKTASSSIIQQ